MRCRLLADSIAWALAMLRGRLGPTALSTRRGAPVRASGPAASESDQSVWLTMANAVYLSVSANSGPLRATSNKPRALTVVVT